MLRIPGASFDRVHRALLRGTLTVALTLGAAGWSHAATIVVTSTLDKIALDGQCTLREAIIAANTNVSAGPRGECAAGDPLPIKDAIVFNNLPGSPDVYKLTIEPADLNTALSGDLNITESVNITGNASWETVIDADYIDRVFHIGFLLTVEVELIALRIQHGKAPHGAGINNEGGWLQIEDSTVDTNLAVCSGYCGVDGGGIRNYNGTLSITRSVIRDNVAVCSGDDCAVSGGGIVSISDNAKLMLHDSLVFENTAFCEGAKCRADGGGIWAHEAVFLVLAELRQNIAECKGFFCTAKGGGLYSLFGSTSLNFANLAGNKAACTGGQCFSYGGGVMNDGGNSGSFDSTFTDNVALASCSHEVECAAFGGAVYDDGEFLLIKRTGFVRNEARCAVPFVPCDVRGGALVAARHRFDPVNFWVVRIVDSTFFANVAMKGRQALGGAIFNDSSYIRVEGSTFRGNEAEGRIQASGGAIDNRANLSMVNSTLSLNVANCLPGECKSDGGGLFNSIPEPQVGAPAGSAFVQFTTFRTNEASCDVKPCQGSGGGNIGNFAATILIKSSIVAGGGPLNCVNDAGGQFSTNGANLDTDGSCPGFTMPSANPMLGALANNGGLTETHALLPGSAAIDAAADCLDLFANAVTTDQRGFTRPSGVTCDLGSFEAGQTFTTGLFDLIAQLGGTMESRLSGPLHELDALLNDDNTSNDRAACGKLTAFLNQVRTLERRGELTGRQADALRLAADDLATAAGCSR